LVVVTIKAMKMCRKQHSEDRLSAGYVRDFSVKES